jgi:anaphase-promoting complex subunit 2
LEDYQRFLATNLLVTRNYDTDNEVRLLEVLKRSFGANKFHECDVMIKDIDDGKRVDKMIHDENHDIATDFHGVILSKHYWPEMKDVESEVKLPEDFIPYMELYGDSYNSLKSNRKLKWLPALAKANVDVEIGDKTINVDLSPWGARILALFEMKRKCTQPLRAYVHILTRKRCCQPCGQNKISADQKDLMISVCSRNWQSWLIYEYFDERRLACTSAQIIQIII